MITIYTDGSARGNPGPGGWAAVVSYEKSVDGRPEEWVRELGGFSEHTTNNRMELMAVIEALKYAPGGEIKLYTDSEYIVKGITVWVHSWQKNNWRTAAKKAVLNQDLWQEMLQVVEGKKINWVVVPGHAGIAANERCDVIATSFADREPVPLYDGPKRGYKLK